MTGPAGAPFLLEVTGHEPLQILSDLKEAVDRSVLHALKGGRHGVLVTQHSYSHYAVALSVEVPYGQIHERRKTASGT